MDGIEGTTRFRSFELEQMMKDECKGIERILIVGMSANSDDQTKQDALSAGMDYFITKVCMQKFLWTYTLLYYLFTS